MAPPSATGASVTTSSHDESGVVAHESGSTMNQTEKQEVKMPTFPMGPTFTDKYKEREYLKGRLALAFRIFAKLGFDEGVAGHITLRVCSIPM
jgi:hypothetical protein